jgi:hypothetical protein
MTPLVVAAAGAIGPADLENQDPDLGPPPSLERPAPVVGGDTAPDGVWDDAVALYQNGQLMCSGVLIAPDLVLTAGHCGTRFDRVVIGTHDLRNGGGQEIRVEQTEVHPDPYTTFDAALLLLEHDAPVEPRKLALDCMVDGWLVPGAEVAIVGFGAVDDWGTVWNGQLNEAFTTVVDPACEDLAAGCNESVSPGGELIAGGDGVDSCVGDSGGPLYLRTEDGDLLVGITSRATVPADAPCGSGGIYVRVDAVADWIESVSGVALERPDCTGFNHPPAPRSAGIDVAAGGVASTAIDPGDEDAGQRHTFAVVDPPRHGFAEIDPRGTLHYVAASTFVGVDAAVVEVTDDGTPPRTGQVEVPIRVQPAEERGGCATAAPPASSWWALLAGLGVGAGRCRSGRGRARSRSRRQ